MKKRGRPRTYERQSVVEKICAGLEVGTPLTAICAEQGMPTPRVVLDWCEEDKDIASAIARARFLGFDAIAEQTLSIADDGRNDTQTDEEGHVFVNNDVIQRSKLRVETRLKLLAKWDPKRYGEQLLNPQTTVNVGVSVAVLTEEKRQALLDKKRRAIERRKTITLEPQ